MQQKPFYSLNKESYKPISHGRSFLHEQYEAINSFIELNFDEKFHGLIAKPIKSGEHVNWYNENISGKIQKLDKFEGQEHEELKKKYNAVVHQINLQCEKFENSDDENNKAWAESIREVFDINRNMVFSNGEDITIIWGYEFKERGKYYLPLEAFAPLLIEPSDSPELEEPIIPEDVIEEEIINEPTDETESEQNLHYETIEEKPQTKKKIPKPVKSTHWFLLMLNSIERFAKKYWYILLIIFLFLLLWFLLRDCSGVIGGKKDTGRTEAEKKVRLKEIMPPRNRERIIPIDTTKIIEDDNGGRVVSNILNMAIADENISFSDFAIELKDLYPSEDYIITYKDTETNRLVFQFPDGQKDSVRIKVKNNLSNYDPLIWEEEVFPMNKRFNDPAFTNQNKNYHIVQTGADKAWDITTGDTSITIAIIDNAFDLRHREIKSNIKGGRNTARRIRDIFKSRNDKLVHGTHVAGIALGKANNNFGLCGIAPDCSFMPIQATMDDESFFGTDVIDGVLYAINHGADVINMSLGPQYRNPITRQLLIPPIETETELKKWNNNIQTDQAEFWNLLLERANKKNIFVVIAGGNDNITAGIDPKSRSAYALKVCATDKQNKRASFSNFCVQNVIGKDYISAPGDNIFSASRNNKFKFESGTSMASPLVAGAIGLIKSVNNELTNEQIMDVLKKTSLNLRDSNMPGFIQIDKAVLEAKKLKN